MWLVLCDDGDEAARWAYEGLRERGLAPLEFVLGRHLVHAPRSAHRVETGGADFEVALPDGRTLVSGAVEGVLNRLDWAPVGDIFFATAADTLYAREELSALVLSWLESIVPVMVNRPSPYGLSGAWRSAAEWAVLAARAGLPVAPVRLGEDGVTGADTDVVVLGEQVFGDAGGAAGPLAPACVRLARAAGAELLGVNVRAGGGAGPRFAGASVLPDLRIGGDTLLDALHRRLTGRPPALAA
ncbi:hypothetical protein PO587_33065 [Streptomyces gilvifuscus]|uniref:Uncharacterized protein n=1 Tax=Streptomyces gilvifuscus TaxID=1550617 RepID=A0ABT5G3L0_9ACTN|nr:hypothetical protein [Streptomyces gilvifuscus]MDC2959275.1 hypothetical protein [Streptomyces gilvifuscus]